MTNYYLLLLLYIIHTTEEEECDIDKPIDRRLFREGVGDGWQACTLSGDTEQAIQDAYRRCTAFQRLDHQWG